MNNDRYKYLFKCEMYFQSVWDDDIFVLFANREITHEFSLPLRTEFRSFQEAYLYSHTTAFAELLKPLSEEYEVWKIKRMKDSQVLMECTLTKMGVVTTCIISSHFKNYAINQRQKELCLLSENLTEHSSVTDKVSYVTGDILFDENMYFVYVTPIALGNKHIVIGHNPVFNDKIDCEIEITNDRLINMKKVQASSSVVINSASDVLKKSPESYIMWRMQNFFLNET